MRGFDLAIRRFEKACQEGMEVKLWPGAAYRTRLDAAFENVKQAYDAACMQDDLEMGRGLDKNLK